MCKLDGSSLEHLLVFIAFPYLQTYSQVRKSIHGNLYCEDGLVAWSRGVCLSLPPHILRKRHLGDMLWSSWEAGWILVYLWTYNIAAANIPFLPFSLCKMKIILFCYQMAAPKEANKSCKVSRFMWFCFWNYPGTGGRGGNYDYWSSRHGTALSWLLDRTAEYQRIRKSNELKGKFCSAESL